MSHENPSHLKIILTIALKDIKGAIKDNLTLGVIIGVFLLILPSQLIPLILQNESKPQAVIFSSQPSSLTRDLSELPGTSAYTAESLLEMRNEIASGRSQVIGLSLPEEFQEKIASNEQIIIDGFVAHWSSREETQQLVQHFEKHISQITGSPVQITLVDNQVHPGKDSRGSEVMFILQMINAIMTISLVLVPHLLMVEKEKHTLDALLVTPASFTDLIIGKGLAGAFYGSLGAFLVIIMNTRIIAHWWLLILTALSGICFAVLLGLLVGLLFDNFQQATLAMSAIVTLAIAPAFITLILTIDLPEFLETIINWLPSAQISNLILVSLMKTVEIRAVILGMAGIWTANLLLFGLNTWKIQQQLK